MVGLRFAQATHMVGLRFAQASGALRRGGAGCAGVGFTSGPAHGANLVGRSPRLETVGVGFTSGPSHGANLVGRLLALAVALLVAGGCGDGGEEAAPGAQPTTTVERATAEEVPVAVGECGNVPRLRVGGALDPSTIEVVGCTDPHDIEIGAVFEYPAGADLDFPGAVSVDGYATDQCIERFEAYVGAPYATSVLDVLIIAPDEDGWDDGDRRIACVLYHVDFQELTGPAAGSGL